jgi:hypothetical protein
MEVTFQEDEWDEYEDDGDHLIAYLLLEDNFAMNAKEGNEKGMDFYILIYTQTNFMVEKPFTYPWGQ